MAGLCITALKFIRNKAKLIKLGWANAYGQRPSNQSLSHCSTVSHTRRTCARSADCLFELCVNADAKLKWTTYEFNGTQYIPNRHVVFPDRVELVCWCGVRLVEPEYGFKSMETKKFSSNCKAKTEGSEVRARS